MDRLPIFLSLLLITFSFFSEVQSTTFKIVNKCRHTVWPGVLTGADRPPVNPTGFVLKSGKSKTLKMPRAWSGRVWGRTLCSNDPSTGKFTCVTGDCGSGKVECAGAGAIPPASLAEFTLNGDQGLDFYDVSLVDGYNLPMLIVAKGGTRGGCSATGCLIDLNGACPKDLRVASGSESVGCKSACLAFNDPIYCCSEAYNTPDTCHPSSYSLFFKHACPRSYSYAYDDKTSTFTCASADYLIMFCPPPYTSQQRTKRTFPCFKVKNDGLTFPCFKVKIDDLTFPCFKIKNDGLNLVVHPPKTLPPKLPVLWEGRGFHIHNEGAFGIGICGLRESQTPDIHGAKLLALRYQEQSQKVLGARKDSAELPLVNKTMMYIGKHH